MPNQPTPEPVWTPTGRWRVLAPDGTERVTPTRHKAMAIAHLCPGDTLEQLHVARAEHWKPVKP